LANSYLYRGVSTHFHEARGGTLVPKVQGPFTYGFHWGEAGFTWDSGATWNSSKANAVIRHQLNQEGFPTAGISTTLHRVRAEMYARGQGGRAAGFIYKIDREALSQHGVLEFIVSHFCAPSIPEDDEVILVTKNGASLPTALIIEVIPVKAIENEAV
jgi:hypothetical protein